MGIPSVFSIQRGRFEENRHSRVARMSDPSRFANLPEIMVVEFKEPESQTVGFWDSIWGTTEVAFYVKLPILQQLKFRQQHRSQQPLCCLSQKITAKIGHMALNLFVKVLITSSENFCKTEIK